MSWKMCETCGGDGKVTRYKTCHKCDGDGEYKNFFGYLKKCGVCKGSGETSRKVRCPAKCRKGKVKA